MDGHDVGFVIGVALVVGVAVAGKLYGPKVEKRLERILFAFLGACLGFILLLVAWAVVFGFGETRSEREIERTLATARPAIDAYRVAADRYVESGCADGASMWGEPTEKELLCPAGMVLDFRWFAVIDPMVKAGTKAPPACYERVEAAVGQANFVSDQIRRAAIEIAAGNRPGQASRALRSMDRAFAELDAVYAAARAACRAPT